MESAQSQGLTKYLVFTTVVKTEEKFDRIHVTGFGPETKFKEVSRGWFVYLKGSYEALHLGHDKPDFKHGDRIKITFERVEDEKAQG